MSPESQPQPNTPNHAFATAQRVQQFIKNNFGTSPWFCGCGIRVDRDVYAIRVNVSDTSAATIELPREIDGVPIEILADVRYEAH